jgi:hypothetical protein
LFSVPNLSSAKTAADRESSTRAVKDLFKIDVIERIEISSNRNPTLILIKMMQKSSTTYVIWLVEIRSVLAFC